MAKAKKRSSSSTSKAGVGETSLKIWAVLRVLIGFIMLWALMDKMFGLGYSTCRIVDDPKTKASHVEMMCEKSWLGAQFDDKTASPTKGFLANSPQGPFKDVFNNLAGKPVVDFLFMSGLLLIGISLILGVGVRVASVSGALLLLMMWSAVLPPANNPLIDDHIVYAVVLMGVMATNASQVWGLGQWWQKQDIVKKYPFLA